MKRVLYSIMFILALVTSINAEVIQNIDVEKDVHKQTLFIQKVYIEEIDDFFIYAECSQVLHDPYQAKCYDYGKKTPKFNMYYLNKEIVWSKNIKKRPSFKNDPRIPKEYQNNIGCYKYTGTDKGHLLADANFDFNWDILKTAYLMSNIAPEYAYVNRYVVSKMERVERNLAKEEPIIVISGIVGDRGHLQGREECPIIPQKIYKRIYKKDSKTGKWKLYLIMEADNDPENKEYKTIDPNRNNVDINIK